MNGCRPIVEYMTFNFVCGIDQIINNAAKMRQMTGQLIVFRGPTASAGQLVQRIHRHRKLVCKYARS
jgi:pyruvate dehydrogenase E1 component beta subunit